MSRKNLNGNDSSTQWIVGLSGLYGIIRYNWPTLKELLLSVDPAVAIPTVLLLIILIGIALIVREAIKQSRPQLSQPNEPYQREPVYPPKRPKPQKAKHQRIPVTHPKRNDWRTPRNPVPSASKAYKPAPLNPIKVSDQQRPQPELEPLPAYHRKQRELLNLLNGDHATAQRLLNQCKQSNPGSSADWIFEKVIFDIVRDRR